MDDVRWLDEGEQRIWRDYLEATSLLASRLARDLDDSEHDLVITEYELLVRLSEAPGRRLRMSDLADGLVHSRSRLTHAISRMEARGLVRRESCPGDRRGVLATMTDAGWEALVAAAPRHVTAVRQDLFDPLDDADVAALGRVVATLVRHLRAAEAACDPAQPTVAPNTTPSAYVAPAAAAPTSS